MPWDGGVESKAGVGSFTAWLRYAVGRLRLQIEKFSTAANVDQRRYGTRRYAAVRDNLQKNIMVSRMEIQSMTISMNAHKGALKPKNRSDQNAFRVS
jgi:hypothetical protein